MDSQHGPGQAAPDEGFDTAWVDLTPAEAMSGGVRVVTVPPYHHPVTVQIPAGIGDRTALRVPGAGNVPAAGAPPRDLVVVVRVVGPAPYGPYPPGLPPGAPAPAAATTNRRTGWLIGIAAAVAVVLAAGCCGGALLLASNDDGDQPTARPLAGRTGAAGTATSAPSAAPTPVDAQAYQQVLTGLDRALTSRLKAVGAARSPRAVGTAADGLSAAIRQQRAKLAAVLPPGNAGAAHAELLTGLEELALAVDDAASAADGQRVCAGSAATALVSRSPSVQQVRTAAQRLAAADPARRYTVGAFLPRPAKDTNRRLRTGTYVVSGRGGSGHLKIDNGGRSDTVVSVVKKGARKPVIRVYVRARGKHTVRGVRDGTYQIFMASGADWDARSRRFTRNCGFSRFEDTMKFRTTSVQYTIWSITLTPVAGGNARTTDVDPDAFPGN